MPAAVCLEAQIRRGFSLQIARRHLLERVLIQRLRERYQIVVQATSHTLTRNHRD